MAAILNPAFPATHSYLGNFRGQTGDTDAAVLHYQEAIRLDPSYTDALNDLAMAYLWRGEFEMAVSQAQNSLAIDPNSADAFSVLSMAYSRLGQFDRSEEALQTAETMAAQSQSTQLVAIAFWDINDFDRAKVHLLQAGSGLRWVGNHSLSLAALYTAQGRLDQALEAIEQAVAAGANPVVILERQADVSVEMADLTAARDQLSQASQIMPERGSVHTGLAWVHLHRGEVQEAEREARRALELAPYEAVTHTILSLALHAQGNLDGALIEAREAVRLDPMRDLAHYALGLCYRSFGDDEQARVEFERFLELYWDRALVRAYRVEVEEYLLQE
jgi:tetratricopeptide (TPR) repeat protein